MSSPIEGDDDRPGCSQEREGSLNPSGNKDTPGTQGTSPADQSPGSLPKKGILKRPSIKKNRDAEEPATTTGIPQLGTTIGFRSSPDRNLFPGQSTKIPKLSVSWFEKNAVAIFGDTSDENNTDSDQNMLNDLGNGVSRSVRQTAILDSDDDSARREQEEVQLLPLVEEKEERVDEEAEDESMEQEEYTDRDDSVSMTSSVGSGGSSIVGRWWVGKDTRYVPHCVKRGCKHNHHEQGEYLTPTQRKTKEIAELKKELKRMTQERDDKEKHLLELRANIDRIEQMQDSNSTVAENRRLMCSQKEALVAFEKEKKQMEKRHAVRVNQLVHETMASRDENLKLAAIVKELENRYVKETVDSETNTDVIVIDSMGIQYAATPTIIPGTPVRGYSPIPGATLSPVASMTDMTIRPPSALQGGPISPIAVNVDGLPTPIILPQEAAATLQAYQNEAFIWRNKAAQLEIVVKDQLLKASQQETALAVETETLKRECQRLKDLINERHEGGGGLIDSGIDAPSSPHREMTRVESQTVGGPGECQMPACIERKKNLINENNALIETNEEVSIRIRELEEDVAALRREVEEFDEKKAKQKKIVENALRDCESKEAECAAANIVIGRLQTDRETMQKAIAFMEEKMTAYQNCILDNGLVLQDEDTQTWRRGFANPKYIVSMSKKCQTTLTAESLNKHMDEFNSVQQKLKALHEEFASKRSDLSAQFEEIEKNLITKTTLVETLTKQLEEIRKEQRMQIDEHQREREEFKKTLEEIGEVAQRVPGLEQRIEQLLQEKSQFDVRMKKSQEDYEKGLEDALAEALRKYQEQSRYWKDRCTGYGNNIQKLKNEIQLLNREKDEMKIKSKLEKADLEHRLTSSIDHVSVLNKEVHKSKRDVEVEAKPRHTSKYVACKPNTRSKATFIDKGDLFDEQEERLKLCQGELSTTRRQVNSLQQKLVAFMQDKADRSRSRGRVACIQAKEKQLENSASQKENKDTFDEDDFKDEIRRLKQNNKELTEKLDHVEEEKVRLVREERNRIQQLVQEFDNVRKELDQEIGRYVSEKKWLKRRIENLERANTELERIKNASPSPILGAPTIKVDERGRFLDMPERSEIRKTFSAPDLNDTMESEREKALLDEIERLNRELREVHQSVVRTASAASEASRHSKRSQLSPAFHNLVDDINSVKGALDKMLMQPEPCAASGRVVVVSPPPADDKSEASELLDTEVINMVMDGWETEERVNLAKALAKSRKDREKQKKTVDRLRRLLDEQNNELELFRRETKMACQEEVRREEQEKGMSRSKSSQNLRNVVNENAKECKRWQEKAGTMFRELHRMRQDHNQLVKERRELMIQLAMQRGELELTRIQLLEQRKKGSNGSINQSAVLSSNGIPIVKEMSVPLHIGDSDLRLIEKTTKRGSQILVHDEEQERKTLEKKKANTRGYIPQTHEKVFCSIRAPSTSKDAVNKRDTRRASLTSKTSRRRSESMHSAKEFQHPRTPVRTKSSSQFESSPGVYATAAQSLASLYRKEPSVADEDHATCPTAPSCSMSQSWHAANNEDSDSLHGRTKQQKTVPLRDKVKSLLKENKELKEDLERLKKDRSVAPVQIVVPNKTSQIEILEQENERLSAEVRRLRGEINTRLNGSSVSLDADLPRLTDENNSLRQRIAELQFTTELQDSEERRHRLEEEKRRLEKENENLRMRLESAERSSLESESMQLKMRVQRMEAESEPSPSGPEDSATDTDTAAKENALKERVNELEHQLATSTSTEDVQTALEEKKKIQKENKVLRERIEGLERHMMTEKEQLIAEHTKRVEVLERGRKNVLQENTLMMTKLETMNEDLEAKGRQLGALEKENAYIAEENRTLRAKLSDVEEKFKQRQQEWEEELDSSMKKLEAEAVLMKNDMEIAVESAKIANDELEESVKEQQTLKEANNWLTKEVETLRENIDELRTELEQRMQSVQMSFPKKSRLVEALEDENEELTSLNRKLESDLETLKAEVEKASKKMSDDVLLKVELTKRENEMYAKKIRELESERSDMYLVMFRKGQQAVKFEEQEKREIDQLTEDRITLRFLRDAFFYYLLNKGDEKDHLHAIMTMLDFSMEQKDEVMKKRKTPERK